MMFSVPDGLTNEADMNRLSLTIVCAVLAAGIGGCATVPDSIVQQPAGVRPQVQPAAAPSNGAIFQSAAYRPMFEDRRARLVGDIITITINESTSAGKAAATTGSKTGSVNYSAGPVLGLAASTVAKAAVTGGGANKFEEKGAASSSNNFSGTITATVVDVLPNGHLVVSGEKQIALDKGVEYVRFSGVVSPDTVGRGNVVSSTQVADARLEYRTNSRIDRAEMASQLARFFFSLLPL
jgi:flagellar L-ring protein precursor FlgH